MPIFPAMFSNIDKVTSWITFAAFIAALGVVVYFIALQHTIAVLKQRQAMIKMAPPALRGPMIEAELRRGYLFGVHVTEHLPEMEQVPAVRERLIAKSSTAWKAGLLSGLALLFSGGYTVYSYNQAFEVQNGKFVYFGQQLVGHTDGVVFNFNHAQTPPSKYVTLDPWTYIVPADGHLALAATFELGGASYVSCQVVVTAEAQIVPHQIGKPEARTATPGSPVTGCTTEASTGVKKGDHIQVVVGQAGFTPTDGPQNFRGRISVEYVAKANKTL